MLAILAALINIFPEILDMLNPAHPLTQRVKDLLPVKSASEEALEELRGKK